MIENLLSLIQKLKYTLQNWPKLGPSLLGKINILRMITIPQINYITYIMPLSFHPLLLKRLNKAGDNFVWQGKSSLFNRTKVYPAKEDRGLSLPKMNCYHSAFSLSQLSKLIFYRKSGSRLGPDWEGTNLTFPTTGFHSTYISNSNTGTISRAVHLDFVVLWDNLTHQNLTVSGELRRRILEGE